LPRLKDLTRDEAVIVMVESNLQRSTILPSEKAFAYKMRLEAMKRQAGRPAKDNYSPVGNNSEFATSSDELAEKVGESKNQIFRYIRLTELVPEILQMVDERQIAFRPAVEISYLSEEQQYAVFRDVALYCIDKRRKQAFRGIPVSDEETALMTHILSSQPSFVV
jgi:ParB family chromosome partitioning protein